MKFLDLLKKLGIVRCGVQTAVYTSGQDRPAEFLPDDLSPGDRQPEPQADNTPPE